jgi:hypothetical protein
MTDTPSAAVARRAAARLAPTLDPRLPDHVAQALAEDQPVQRVYDLTPLAALLVSAASLGWTIYRDLKRDHAAASAEHLATHLAEDPELSARQPPGLAPPQRDLLLQTVAAEIVATGDG